MSIKFLFSRWSTSKNAKGLSFRPNPYIDTPLSNLEPPGEPVLRPKSASAAPSNSPNIPEPPLSRLEPKSGQPDLQKR